MNIKRLYRWLGTFIKMIIKPFYLIIFRKTLRLISVTGGTTNIRDLLTALKIILNHKNWQKGHNIRKLERMFMEYLGVRYAVSFNGARVGLRAILEAMDIGNGDEVILPGYTCVVVPNALLYRGIYPVYVDIDLETFTFTIDQLQKSLTQKTRAIVLQYNYGLIPDNLSDVVELAQKHGVKVIEDCAAALGASYRGQKVGTFGDAAIFSTEQTKCISTQFGGMAVTNDFYLGEKLTQIQSSLRFPSKNQIKLRLFQFIFNYFNFHPVLSIWFKDIASMIRSLFGLQIQNMNIQELSCVEPADHNVRMPNAMATLGIRQMEYIDQYANHRRFIAGIYNQILKTHLKVTQQSNDIQNAYLRYPILVLQNRDKILKKTYQCGIQLGEWFNNVIHPCGVPLDKLKYIHGSCPQAEKVAGKVLNLPTHPSVSEKDAKRIACIILKAIDEPD